MQLETRDGISCDHCRMQCRQEFVYYSVDIRDARLQYGMPLSPDSVRRLKVSFGYDLCTACYDSLTRLVIQHYKPVPVGLICDLSGVALNGVATYHYVDITRVQVKVPPTGKADISTYPRELELAISPQACAELVNRVLECRKAATPWHAKSST